MRILCFWCFWVIALLLAAPATPWAQTPATKKPNGNPPAKSAQVKATPTPTPTPAPRAPESFTLRLLRFFGLTVLPDALKGAEEEEDRLRGDIWLVTDLQQGLARRLTFAEAYHAPLLSPDGKTVWALQEETVVAVPVENGKLQLRFLIPGILKLAAVDEAGQQLVMLRAEGGNTVVETLALADGKRAVLRYDAQADAGMLAYLRGWERSYDGGRFRLFTRDDPPRNVYLEQAQATVKLSHCVEAEACGQAALASAARLAVFIKGARQP
ncbi:MAG: hypothetical protein HYR56_25525 [Acidobacteria bacterium]|nr:hypothetical protein [Acidobacteriota bacterium]MBI3423305.1 hypothetical protein [Acidobacteriota bacterium]